MLDGLTLAPPPERVAFAPDPAADLPRSAEVLIVGAGLTGAWAAYHLTRRGVRPLIVEANAPASGASGRNGGMLLQGLGGHFPRVTALAQAAGARSILDYTGRSRELVVTVDGEIPGGVELEHAGSLDLFLGEEQRTDRERSAAAQRTEGLDVRLIDARQVAELEPALDRSRVLGASWTPSDLVLNPFRLTLGLLRAAVARGARLVSGVRVEALIERSGSVQGGHTSHGDVEADATVLATNAWTGSLAPQLALNLTPIREHVCVTEPVAPIMRAGFETNRCNEYWRQMRSGEIVIGGFATVDEGMGIGSFSMDVRPAVPPLLAGLLVGLFPALADLRIVRCWTGLLDFAALEIPMVGRLPAPDGGPMPGAYVACGLTGHGMPYTPVIGELLAELITEGAATTLSLDPFDPTRYVGTRHAPTWLEPFGVTATTVTSAGSATSPPPR